jgi:hypothetical protein
VDFQNAFNLVRRDVLTQAVLDHFPALEPWVTLCYDAPSHLFYDEGIICSSAQGVLQSDPLGPLLFCLVMRHVSLGIEDIFESAGASSETLNTSYLDDGMIAHNMGTLTRVVEYLQSPEVRDLGLSLI